MIEKKTVCQIVEEWLEGKDYFLVEVTVSPDDKIVDGQTFRRQH